MLRLALPPSTPARHWTHVVGRGVVRVLAAHATSARPLVSDTDPRTSTYVVIVPSKSLGGGRRSALLARQQEVARART